MSKKIFFISVVDIYDKNGNGGIKGSQRNYELLKVCFGEENVILASFPKEEYTEPPSGAIMFERTQNNFEYLVAALFGCKVYYPWKEKDVVRFIEKQNIDLLFIDSSIIGRLACVKRKYKTVVFYHNIETDYAMNKVRNEGLFFLPSYWASKYNDRCGARADGVICLNERDSERLYGLFGRKADFLLPVTLKDTFKEERTRFKYKREILFLGSLFSPNQISIEWFMKEVMPKLRDIQLKIVGKGFESKKKEYEKYENVNVIGTVEEPDQYYYQHAAVVLPIRYGAGMKVKTAEAMMFGRRIFASDEALEGYDVQELPGITRCNEADEFAEAINLYFDKEETKPYEPEVRRRFMEKYETNCLMERFKDFLNSLLNS